jgi:putative nucleotidyltransferase with HDIG domain
MIERREIVEGMKKLPAFSPTVVRLGELMADDDAGPGEYEAVIQVDVTLTASLLKMANSAYFGFSRKIGSVREAITLLGMRRLFELSTMAAMESLVPAKLPGYGIDSGTFWCHSVATAVLGERLAKERKLSVPTLTFTAGLLHDIGKLVISDFLARDPQTLAVELFKKDAPLLQCEREIVGADHAKVGAELAAAWNLPEEVAKVIAFHHDPDSEEINGGCVIVDLVHAADCLSHSLGFGADVGELHRQLGENAVRRLGLRPSDLEHVACRALPEIEGLKHFNQKKDLGERP